MSISSLYLALFPIPLAFFGQTFASEDVATIGMLVALEGVLSIDNAMVLGLLALRVEPRWRGKALSYGLIGALVLRLAAVALAAYLLRWSVIKLIGGGYLVWIALKHFWSHGKPAAGDKDQEPSGHAGFWSTVFAIELMDLAFAADSILAAVALVGSPPPGTPLGSIHPKLWVVITGGMIGVILMRFAAAIFTHLLQRFPRLNLSAYLIVALIGMKLILDWGFNTPEEPDRLNFNDPSSIFFWVFWGLMIACLVAGFIPQRSAEAMSIAPKSAP